METKKRNIITVVITYAFALVVLLGIGWVNRAVDNFSFVPRLILVTVAWWPMLIATIFFMRRDKEGLKDIGFTKEKILIQILLGVLVAAGSLLIFIVIPALFGIMLGYVGNLNVLSIVLNFVYILLSVALVEEIIFRGHLFKKLLDIKGSMWFAIILSSVLFGFFHIFNWSIWQIIITTVMGIYWCTCRLKLKHCTLLTLIIAHALHNALLPVITAVMF